MHNNIQYIPFCNLSDSDVFALFSNAELLKYTDVPLIHSLEEVSYIRSYYSETRLAFGIERSNTCIGMLGACCNTKHRTAAITYILLPSFQRKGYMQQALAWFQTYLFEHCIIYRIEAQTYVNNSPSIQLLETMGYTREGCLRKNFMIANSLEDSYIYSKLYDE